MKPAINETHDPATKSWVVSANQPGTDFPVQNLPFGMFRRRGSGDTPHVCVAIGDYLLDVAACDAEGLFPESSHDLSQASRSSSLNRLMALGPMQWSALRRQLHNLLRATGSERTNAHDAAGKHLVPIIEAELLLPAEIGDYTDFYTSIYLKSNPGCSSGVNPGNVAAYINISCFTVPLQNGTTLTSANCKSFSTVANSCSNLMGNSGRNSLIGPGSAEVDFSVIKNNQITEKFNAQFRAEMFNVLNRANFNFPAASGTGIVSIFGPTGAPVAGATSITSTATTSRQIQFALKLIW